MDSAERPTVSPALDAVDERLLELTGQLGSAAGDASLCQISRSTGPVDGVKYLEGRVAVLSELKRAARRRPDLPLASVADPILRQWRSDLGLQQERGATKGWVAYRAGGVDELSELFGQAAPSR